MGAKKSLRNPNQPAAMPAQEQGSAYQIDIGNTRIRAAAHIAERTTKDATERVSEFGVSISRVTKGATRNK